ncbi:MAG TPA: PfkB family carbohydrate kinase [Planctomycetota bacterium]|jgi:sugar/nucleoside kinase (ribokinase family)|nr:PfkB family carbohydrate kinase [Planctomycetota bacterium]
MNSVLAVGSVALDTLETPHGRADNALGGSATHFALAASRFAPVRIVGVVGKDFPPEHLAMLEAQKIDISGLEIAEGKTFRWHGRFEGDMGRAQTVSVELGVLRTFQPKVPAGFASTPYVLLGNSAPATQAAVLDQLKGPKFVMLDTMNLWIGSERPALVRLLPRVDAVCINFEEALQLADTTSGAKAIRKILDLGAKTLIMKRGEHGATLATRDGQFSVPSFPTDRVVDPTGAGDSFAGGTLGYLAQAGPEKGALRRAMVYGTVMGSFAVEEFGTRRIQDVTREEVETRAKAVLEMLRV